MANVSKEELYCKLIDVLFAGAVQATPDEINDEVIRIVDTMLVEITKCHNTVKPLAVLFDGLATMYENAVPEEIKLLIASTTWQDYLKGKIQGAMLDKIKEILGVKIPEPIEKAQKTLEIAQVFYESWIKYSQKDRRLLLCIRVC
ncbi:hypothetical protein ACEYX6_06295 [Acinetobacter sp. c2-A9]|uniref:hypothetical protein n=1 Tax=Acinetobacter sp. c2-A9 TaxID=3342802 RepID=UPI0035B7886D